MRCYCWHRCCYLHCQMRFHAHSLSHPATVIVKRPYPVFAEAAGVALRRSEFGKLWVLRNLMTVTDL